MSGVDLSHLELDDKMPPESTLVWHCLNCHSDIPPGDVSTGVTHNCPTVSEFGAVVAVVRPEGDIP